MSQHYFFYKRRSGFAEKRLLARQKSPDVLKKASDVYGALTTPNANPNSLESNIKTNVENLPEAERIDVLDTISEQLNALDPKVLEVASQNLEKLAITSASNQLDAMRKLVDTAQENAKKKENVSAESVEDKKGELTPEMAGDIEEKSEEEKKKRNIWENIGYYSGWSSLSDQAKQNVKGGAFALGAVYVTVKVAGWIKSFFLGTKKAAAKTVEASKWSIKKMLFYGALAAGAGAAFFGYKKLTDKLNAFAKKIDSATDAASKAAIALREKSKKGLDNTKNIITGEPKEPFDPKKFEQQVKEAKSRFSVLKTDGRVDVSNQADAEKLLGQVQALQSQIAEYKGDDNGDVVKELASIEFNLKEDINALDRLNNNLPLGATTGATYSLVTFYGDNVEWPDGTNAKSHNTEVSGVLSSMRSTRMGEIFACYDTGMNRNSLAKIYPELNDERYGPAYEAAVKLVVKTCTEKREKAKKAYKTLDPDSSVPLNNLTLGHYLRLIVGGGQLAQSMGKSLEEKGVVNFDKANLRELAAESKDEFQAVMQQSTNSLLATPQLVEAFQQDYDLTPEEVREGMKTFSFESLAHLETILSGTVLQFINMTPKQLKATNPNLTQQQYVHACVLQQLCKNYLPEPESLAPYFHEIFPDAEWSDNKSDNYQKIQQYLQDMSVHKALRLFAYDRMIKGGNAMGVMLTQYEILHFIRKKEPAVFSFKVRSNQATQRMLERIRKGTFGQLISKANEEIDQNELNKALNTLLVVGEKVAVKGISSVLLPSRVAIETVLGFRKNNPIPSRIIEGTLGTFFGIKLFKFARSRRDPDAIIRNLNQSSKTWLRESKIAGKLGVISRNTVENTATKLANINEKLKKKDLDDYKPLFKKLLRKGGTQAEWLELSADLRKCGIQDGIEAADLAEEIANNPSARRAIKMNARIFTRVVAKFGVSGTFAVLNGISFFSNHLPDYLNREKEITLADLQKKNELSDMLRIHNRLKAAEGAYRLSAPLVQYIAMGRAMGRASFTGILATELLFSEVNAILEPLSNQLKEYSMSAEEFRSLDEKELLTMLSDYRAGSMTGTQRLRAYSGVGRKFMSHGLADTTKDSFSGMAEESKIMRKKLFDAMLFARFSRNLDRGQLFATQFEQLLNECESEKKVGEGKTEMERQWYRYTSNVREYIAQKYGVEATDPSQYATNDLEHILTEAEKYARIKLDLYMYTKFLALQPKLVELAEKKKKEIEGIENTIAKKESEFEKASVIKRRFLAAELVELRERDLHNAKSELSLIGRQIQEGVVRVAGLAAIIFEDDQGEPVQLVSLLQDGDGKIKPVDSLTYDDIEPAVKKYSSIYEQPIIDEMEQEMSDESDAYIAYIREAKNIIEPLMDRAKKDRMDIAEQHSILQSYALFLDKHPFFDKDNACREAIRSISVIDISKEDINRALQTIQNRMNEFGFDQYRFFIPVNRYEDIETERTARLGNSVYVEIDDTERLFVIKANQKRAKFPIEGVGTLVCQWNAGGSYTWEIVDPEYSGMVYIYGKDSRGVEQKGVWLEFEKVSQEEKETEKNFQQSETVKRASATFSAVETKKLSDAQGQFVEQGEFDRPTMQLGGSTDGSGAILVADLTPEMLYRPNRRAFVNNAKSVNPVSSDMPLTFAIKRPDGSIDMRVIAHRSQLKKQSPDTEETKNILFAPDIDMYRALMRVTALFEYEVMESGVSTRAELVDVMKNFSIPDPSNQRAFLAKLYSLLETYTEGRALSRDDVYSLQSYFVSNGDKYGVQ